MTARAVSRIAFSRGADGVFPAGVSGAYTAKQSGLSVVYAGDSRTVHAFHARWSSETFGVFGRSNASALSAGDGTLTLYSNSTATWAAPGDTTGVSAPVGAGLVFLESGSANKGCCFNITSAAIDTYGTVEGFPITVTIGASTYIGTGEEAAATWAQILSGQKMRCAGVFGIDGETAAGLNLRAGQLLDVDNFGVQSNRDVNLVVIDIGTNDATYIAGSEPGYSVAGTMQEIMEACDEITSRGACVLLSTLIRQSPSAGEFSVSSSINNGLFEISKNNPLVEVADVYSAVKDPNLTNGNAVANALVALHWTGYGAKLAGQVVADKILSIVGGSIGSSDFYSGSSLTNLVENGALSGTAGSMGGMTGQTAVDAVYSGTGTCVASKEAVSGWHDWQVYTITGAAADDQLLLIPAMTVTAGANVYGQVEYMITGAGAKNIDAAFKFSDGDALEEIVRSANVSDTPLGLGEMRGVLCIQNIDAPSWLVDSQMLIAVTMSAGDSVIKIRDIGAAA